MGNCSSGGQVLDTQVDESNLPTPGEVRAQQLAITETNASSKNRPENPFPSSVLKENLLAKFNFTKIDTHAGQAPATLLEGDLSGVIKFMKSVSKSDIELVRGLTVWMASQPIESLKSYEVGDKKSVASQLYELKSGYKGYVDFFSDLCREASIPQKIITGKVKGYDYSVGDRTTIAERCRWNAVFVHHTWCLIHPLWISQSMSEYSDANWTQIENDGDVKVQRVEKEGKIIHHYDDDFFLIDPHMAAFLFHPDDSAWQLLAKPWQLSEFENVVYITTAFVELDLDIINQRCCTIKAAKGEAEILLRVPSDSYRKWSYNLYIKDSCLDKLELENTKMNRFVYVEQRKEDKNKKLAVIRLRMPMAGAYQLELKCKNSDNDINMPFVRVLTYSILAGRSAVNCDPFPMSGHSEYGPGQNTDMFGIKATSHKKGTVVAEDGEASITFEVKQGVQLSYQIFSNKESKSTMRNHVYMESNESRTTFHCKLPNIGEYCLQIIATERGKRRIHMVCSYLVDSQSCSLIKEIWPSQKDCGITNAATDLGLKQVDHDACVISCGKDLNLQFTTERVADFSWNLSKCDTKEELSSCCFLNMKNVGKFDLQKCPNFTFRFPDTGFYVFSLNGRPRNSSEMHERLATYIIQVKDADYAFGGFPGIGDAWKPVYELITPREKLLPPQENVTFKIKCDQFDDGLEVSRGDSKTLFTGDNGTWSASMETGNKAEDVVVKLSNSKKVLLKYKVMSVDEHNERLKKAKQMEDEFEMWKKERESMVKEREKRLQDLEEKQMRDEAEYERQLKKIMEERKKGKLEEQRKLKEEFSMLEERSQEITKAMKLAIDRKDRKQLEELLRDYKNVNESKDFSEDAIVVEAEKHLNLFSLQEEYEHEVKYGKYETLVKLKSAIETKGLQGEMWKEISVLNERIESLGKVRKLRTMVLKLNNATLMELRKYRKVSPCVHDTMKATLLLVGEHEQRTKSWKRCSKKVTSTGKGNLKTTLLSYDPKNLHPEVWARARDILSPHDIGSISLSSAGGATFFKWATGVIEERRGIFEDSDPTPASIPRQMEIFGVNENLKEFSSEDEEITDDTKDQWQS